MQFRTYPYSEYEALIKRLGDVAKSRLDKNAYRFIAKLLANPPRWLTEAQVDWLKGLEKRNL